MKTIIALIIIVCCLGCRDYKKECEKEIKSLKTEILKQDKIIEELHDYAHMLRKGEKSECCDQDTKSGFRCCHAFPIEEWCPTGYKGDKNCIYCTCGCPPYPDY